MKKKSSLFIIGIILIGLGVVIVFYYKKETIRKDSIQKVLEINENDIVLGDYEAPISLLMYFNYNCGFCNRFFEKEYPQLYNEYIKTGKVKLILRLICSRNNPFELYANQAAICINKHGDFEKLHELYLHNYNIIFTDEFRKLVDEFIFINTEVAQCILEHNEYTALMNNLEQFNQFKIIGTPTFIIDNQIIQGYRDFNYLKELINNHE